MFGSTLPQTHRPLLPHRELKQLTAVIYLIILANKLVKSNILEVLTEKLTPIVLAVVPPGYLVARAVLQDPMGQVAMALVLTLMEIIV
jgi:hypothetical protein